MPYLAATQIPKPSDEQTFERASVILWRCLLDDPNVQLVGRRGQRQNGVDLLGRRNQGPNHWVGVQCKLKGPGRPLTANEVRHEVELAAQFTPTLREYIIATTAPDDANLQTLAATLEDELRTRGINLAISVWGWGTLEFQISEHPSALRAFDPAYSPFASEFGAKLEQMLELASRTAHKIDILSITRLDHPHIPVGSPLAPGDASALPNPFESYLDAEIDEFREMADQGKTRMALDLLQRLLTRVRSTASGRLLFRINSNIGRCHLILGDFVTAAGFFTEAYDNAPREPKAVAGKALALLLRGEWRTVLAFAQAELRLDPTNDALASYTIQAARFDEFIDQPLALVPEQLWTSAPVAVGRIDFLRHRGPAGEWRNVARAARRAHQADDLLLRYAAEADLDEILHSPSRQTTLRLNEEETVALNSAVETFLALWEKARASDAPLTSPSIALCENLILALQTLGDFRRAVEIAKEGIASAPDDPDLAVHAMAAALEGEDDALATEVLPRIPESPEGALLRFRYHLQQGDWEQVANLYQSAAELVPQIERGMVIAGGRLAELKLHPTPDTEHRMAELVSDLSDDPRASVLAANVARSLGLDRLGERAFLNARTLVTPDTDIASRLMVGLQAARFGAWRQVIELLDGYVCLEEDGRELRALATAFVNDLPIRGRGVRFFSDLPTSVATLPYFLRASALLNFNRGALSEATNKIRLAIEAQPALENYIALWAILRRANRTTEITSSLKGLDLTKLEGSATHKIRAARELFFSGEHDRSFEYAYSVITNYPNDPDAALGYFALLLCDAPDGALPSPTEARVDTWVRIRGAHGEDTAFVVEEGVDRPGDGILAPAIR